MDRNTARVGKQLQCWELEHEVWGYPLHIKQAAFKTLSKCFKVVNLAAFIRFQFLFMLYNYNS